MLGLEVVERERFLTSKLRRLCGYRTESILKSPLRFLGCWKYGNRCAYPIEMSTAID